MRTSAVVLILAAGAAAAPVPSPNAREAARLVEKLGSSDFAEREAATGRLDELGVLALDDLRAACKSEDPEIARRAIDLVRRIERRAASERALAPTTVEIDAAGAPLDAVLAALSGRADCDVVLNGPDAPELAAKKVTVATGKVPFWSAVVKVCDAAELQIAGAGGFVAPGSAPYYGRAAKTADGTAVRRATNVERAVVLESRGGAKKRPASVHGAVLVEGFAPPRGTAPPGGAALVQFWPEPKLGWQAVVNLKVERAVGAGGNRLTPDLTPPPVAQQPPGRRPFAVQPNGGPVAPGARFNPNIRQAFAKFKPGDEPATGARELSGSAYALMRSAVEPMATVALDPQKAVAVTGRAGVEMTAAAFTDATGKKFVEVTVAFAPTSVDPVRASDPLPDAKPAATGGNRTVLGVRVTDADGATFPLALAKQRSDFDRTGRRVVAHLTLEAVAVKDGPTEPAQVVFWGSTSRPVEVPFTLKDVPLR
ncbi:MAG: hypothetical protein J0I06_12790 [Planctomycetes bacterium]|nr:hypothetical protein [Planctomycetota bacterium]